VWIPGESLAKGIFRRVGWNCFLFNMGIGILFHEKIDIKHEAIGNGIEVDSSQFLPTNRFECPYVE